MRTARPHIDRMENPPRDGEPPPDEEPPRMENPPRDGEPPPVDRHTPVKT